MRVWCKLIRKWPRNTPYNNNQRYAISSHLEYMSCVSINGPGDLDLLTLKLVYESHQRWRKFIPNLGTPGHRVLQLFAMYDWTVGRTDGQKQRLMLPSLRTGHNSVLVETTVQLAKVGAFFETVYNSNCTKKVNRHLLMIAINSTRVFCCALGLTNTVTNRDHQKQHPASCGLGEVIISAATWSRRVACDWESATANTNKLLACSR